MALISATGVVNISEYRLNKVLLATIFKINKFIELELEFPGKEGIMRKSVPGQIVWVNANLIMVAAPKDSGLLFPVHTGDLLPMRIYRFGALYSCEVQVRGRQKEPCPVLLLSLPHTIEKKQLRNWVRVKVDIPVYYRMAEYPVDYYCGVCCDISGGGICLFTTHLIDVDTMLDMKLKLPYSSIAVVGQVKRCWKDAKASCYKIGIEFKNINEGDQEELVSFIFLKQREIIQKGITDSD